MKTHFATFTLHPLWNAKGLRLKRPRISGNWKISLERVVSILLVSFTLGWGAMVLSPCPMISERGFQKTTWSTEFLFPEVQGDAMGQSLTPSDKSRTGGRLTHPMWSGGLWFRKWLNSLWMEGQRCTLLGDQVQAKQEKASLELPWIPPKRAPWGS